MKDKMIAGALAGTIGAVLQDIYGYVAKVIGFN